jgi:hypothetical protein
MRRKRRWARGGGLQKVTAYAGCGAKPIIAVVRSGHNVVTNNRRKTVTRKILEMFLSQNAQFVNLDQNYNEWVGVGRAELICQANRLWTQTIQDSWTDEGDRHFTHQFTTQFFSSQTYLVN